jgi:hypothetical protein
VLERKSKQRQLLSPSFSGGCCKEEEGDNSNFAFLCGGVATTKVVLPSSLCLKRKRKRQ